MPKRCTKHPTDKYCFDYCRYCGHCDASYNDPSLKCDCNKCPCREAKWEMNNA